jgi:FHS family L-fucose permease-like MFS transporter
MTKPSIFRYEGHNYLVPFLIISSLFFMWGFAHGILEVLNPHFQESFHISKAMSALTQAAVYGAYFLMALPAGWIIRKWGYRRGVITGLVLFGIGALMFLPHLSSIVFTTLSVPLVGDRKPRGRVLNPLPSPPVLGTASL